MEKTKGKYEDMEDIAVVSAKTCFDMEKQFNEDWRELSTVLVENFK